MKVWCPCLGMVYVIKMQRRSMQGYKSLGQRRSQGQAQTDWHRPNILRLSDASSTEEPETSATPDEIASARVDTALTSDRASRKAVGMFERHPPIVGILGNWLPFLSPTGGFCYTMASWIRNSGTETASNVPKKCPSASQIAVCPLRVTLLFVLRLCRRVIVNCLLMRGGNVFPQNYVGIHAPRHACLSACEGSARPALLVAYGSIWTTTLRVSRGDVEMLRERGILACLAVAQWQPPRARIGHQQYGGK